ncbi:MAG: hypothetical protein AUG51_09420 [Acidobacteria bacterium 13_1_20CM_3_53_8]|nr:MAG: hypothetical protein AUG51_09420 [Acidobacteria bacterium 13_1_20CM_3_53_8]
MGERIREVRRSRKGKDGKRLTLVELAERIGTSQPALSMIENGATKEPYPATLVALARELNSDFGEPWLRRHLREDRRERASLPQISVAELIGAVDISIIGRVPAGGAMEPIENIETITLPPSLADRNKRVFALLVQGDSMKDEGIWPGDVVFISECPDPANGQIVVAQVDGEVTLKKWQRKGSRVTLIPANPDYSKKEIKAGVNEVQCIGEYIGLLRIKRRR